MLGRPRATGSAALVEPRGRPGGGAAAVAQSRMGRKRLRRVDRSPRWGDSGHLMLSPPSVCTWLFQPVLVAAADSQLAVFGGISAPSPVLPLLLALGAPPSAYPHFQQLGEPRGGLFSAVAPRHSWCTHMGWALSPQTVLSRCIVLPPFPDAAAFQGQGRTLI